MLAYDGFDLLHIRSVYFLSGALLDEKYGV